MKYKPAELTLRDDSEKEQQRTRTIFEDLRLLAKDNKQLSEHEKNFLCTGIKLSAVDDDSIDNYLACDNFKFKFLYLIYFHDLTGGGRYSMPSKLEMIEVPLILRQQQLQYLNDKSTEWLAIINTLNHTEELLNQVSFEARNELKWLDSQEEFKNGFMFGGRNRYNAKRKAILLQSKYIHCIAKEIFETAPVEEFILAINGENLEFNEFSLVHILNRHYAEMVKQYSVGKSFHTEDFYPRMLHTQLADIFKEVDNSGVLKNADLKRIAFKFSGSDYIVYTELKTKQVKGVGNVQFRRIQTFYPVNEKAVVDELRSDYVLIQLNNDLAVYTKK
ncbi:hypothetical protein [Pedobacter hartonius]|uniref:Uncharacterized protein n=1 Tax=Pedobacter hartonius TaxID=425514 RepID=A0A1H4HK37_9SPHI|nr:hypothetical protein [Pedobacter hartonius]SEB21966.1 hypothetical protein SAMN05443550_1249 [Pedobacter hartonius]